MDINFTVIENDITRKKGIDFTPTKANETDIGYDIRANNIVLGDKVIEEWSEYPIPSGQSVVVGIGANLIHQEPIQLVIAEMMKDFFTHCLTKIFIEEENEFNYEYDNNKTLELFPSSEVHSRSGLGFVSNIHAFNGQIDHTYNKEIRVKLTNNGEKPFIIKYGDRIGQLEIKLIPNCNVNKTTVNDLKSLDMGKRGGFGSTGVK